MGISEKREVIKEKCFKEKIYCKFQEWWLCFTYIILFVSKSKISMFSMGSKRASPWFSESEALAPPPQVNRRCKWLSCFCNFGQALFVFKCNLWNKNNLSWLYALNSKPLLSHHVSHFHCDYNNFDFKSHCVCNSCPQEKAKKSQGKD